MISHILSSLEFLENHCRVRNTSEMTSFSLLWCTYAYANYCLTYMKAIENIFIKYLKLKN